MTAYEAGFRQGEQQAFRDRRAHIRRDRPSCLAQDGYEHGFWDGYTPRSITWLLAKQPEPSWADRESELTEF